MEVGNTRERILIALLYYVFDQEKIRLPPTTSSEVVVFVEGCPISIKTKTGVPHSGIKLKWTVDWVAIQAFLDSFEIVSNLLYVNINWSDVGGFYYIPVTVQHHAVNDLGIKNYVKTPKRGTTLEELKYLVNE